MLKNTPLFPLNAVCGGIHTTLHRGILSYVCQFVFYKESLDSVSSKSLVFGYDYNQQSLAKRLEVITVFRGIYMTAVIV